MLTQEMPQAEIVLEKRKRILPARYRECVIVTKASNVAKNQNAPQVPAVSSNISTSVIVFNPSSTSNVSSDETELGHHPNVSSVLESVEEGNAQNGGNFGLSESDSHVQDRHVQISNSLDNGDSSMQGSGDVFSEQVDSSSDGNTSVQNSGDLFSEQIDSSRDGNTSVQDSSDLFSEQIDSSRDGNTSVQDSGDLFSEQIDSSRDGNTSVQDSGDLFSEQIDSSRDGNTSVQDSRDLFSEHIDSSRDGNTSVQDSGDLFSEHIDSSRDGNTSVQDSRVLFSEQIEHLDSSMQGSRHLFSEQIGHFDHGDCSMQSNEDALNIQVENNDSHNDGFSSGQCSEYVLNKHLQYEQSQTLCDRDPSNSVLKEHCLDNSSIIQVNSVEQNHQESSSQEILDNIHPFALFREDASKQNVIEPEFGNDTQPSRSVIREPPSIMTVCQFCGKSYKHVNKHIVSAHPEEYRQRLANKYVTKSNVTSSGDDRSNVDKNEVEKGVEEWSNKDWRDMNLDVLNENVAKFQTFLKEVVHKLPGPKHPAVKYYEMRKNKQTMASQNSRCKDTSNPQRKTKRDRKKRKESYIYESIQFQYYNCRKKAVRKIIGEESRSCPIKIKDMIEHYQSTLGQENSKTDILNTLTENSIDEEQENISQEEVDAALKGMNMDSSAGPDGVLTRAIKIKGVNLILTKIFNRMLTLGKVVPCLKLARTVLIDKGGQVEEIKNWRPITILPIVRRVFEKILEKRLRDYAVVNTNQRGFISLPGCSINLAIVEKVLETTKHDKSDLVCVFLDINQAYNTVGHAQIKKSLERTNAPDPLKNIIIDCQSDNKIVLEIGADKSSSIVVKQGLMQGAPLSPLLYNIATNHILDEVTEDGLVNNLGVKVIDNVKMLAQAFADDICLMCKSVEAAETMFNLINTRFKELGMKLNPNKTQAIVFKKGVVNTDEFTLGNATIKPAGNEKSIKYLGTTLTDQIILDKEGTMSNLNDKINKIVKSPYLKSEQKMNVLNTYIWPMLTFKLQHTPIDRWTVPFVEDLDKMVRSAVKQILDLPKDVPDAALYSDKNMRGLHAFRFSWEILIQRLNLFVNLQKQEGVIRRIKDLDGEISKCLITLNITNTNEINTKKIRENLRTQEFTRWSEMKTKGVGVCLFGEVKKHNRWLTTKEGLTSSEFTECIKMSTNTAAVRAIPGRSQDGNQCRRCHGVENNKPIETLAHVLGACPFGHLARINRHNAVRSLIANELRKQYEVYEEVQGIATDGSSRRIDMIAIDRKKKKGIIVDPTVRFESSPNQPNEVNEEKRSIYIPTIPYYKEKYGLTEIDVKGLLIGSRGTITSFFKNFSAEFNISEASLRNISQSVIRSSILILRNHIYGI